VTDDLVGIDLLVDGFEVGVEDFIQGDVLVDALEEVVEFLGDREEIAAAFEDEPAAIDSESFGQGDEALEHFGHASADAGGVDVGPDLLVQGFSDPTEGADSAFPYERFIGFDVDSRQGDDFSVTTSVEENIAEYIIIAVEGNTLRLDIDDGNSYHMEGIVMRAEVVMPSLERLVLDLAGDTTISGFQSTNPFDVISSLSGTLQGDIDAGDINLDVSISGRVDLGGSAADLTVLASGSSVVDLADMAVVNADLTAEGGSTIIANASDTLDASVGLNSQVYYMGNPTLGRIETAAGGVVEQTR